VRFLAGASSVVGERAPQAPKQRGWNFAVECSSMRRKAFDPQTPATSASTFVTLGPKSVVVSSLAN
jgi:hypothetical protein